jgi:hypothetical protein
VSIIINIVAMEGIGLDTRTRRQPLPRVLVTVLIIITILLWTLVLSMRHQVFWCYDLPNGSAMPHAAMSAVCLRLSIMVLGSSSIPTMNRYSTSLVVHRNHNHNHNHNHRSPGRRQHHLDHRHRQGFPASSPLRSPALALPR